MIVVIRWHTTRVYEFTPGEEHQPTLCAMERRVMDIPNCTHYDVNLSIHPERVPSVFRLYGGTIAVDCTVTLENRTAQAISAVPFLLYRLLRVDLIDDGAGRALPFTQAVVTLDQEPRWQVNAITISYTPFSGASTLFNANYSRAIPILTRAEADNAPTSGHGQEIFSLFS